MKIIYLLKPSLQLKKERFWLFVIKILNVALFMNESRKIIKKNDPIGNEQWQSMSSKIQNYMINVFIGMDIILKTCLILMININLHYNLLKVHRFIRTHGLFEYSANRRPLVTVEKSTKYAEQVHFIKILNTLRSPL